MQQQECKLMRQRENSTAALLNCFAKDKHRLLTIIYSEIA